jgi:tetratricopeptide (TPR) repeat protein
MGLFNRKTDDVKFDEAFERGLSFYNEDMYDEALEEFHRAKEILSKIRFVDINRRNVMYVIMGELYFIKGCQIEEGGKSFLMVDGEFVDPSQGNFMRSLECYEEAKDEKFNLLNSGIERRISLLHNMAKLLEKIFEEQKVSLYASHKSTRVDEAIKCLEEAVELDPTVSSLFALASMTHKHKFDFEECIKRYDEIILKDPESDWAKHSWNNKGVIYDTMNEYEQANRCYTNAKEYDSRKKDWTEFV